MSQRNLNNNRQRDLTLDLLKLFAIFLVIWGHALMGLRHCERFELLPFRVINSFHMPLFMALAGYFAASSVRLGWREFIVKKFRQLLLPALTFGLVACGIQWLWGTPVSYIEALWFLKSAFLCYLLYYASMRLIRPQWLAVIITLLLSQFLYEYKLNWMYPFFLLGGWLRDNIGLIRRHAAKIALAAGAAFVLLVCITDENIFVEPRRSEILHSLPGTTLVGAVAWQHTLQLLLGLTGTLLFVSLFEWLATRLGRSRAGEFLGRYGAYTLGVYLFQTVILEIVLDKLVNFDGMPLLLYEYVVTPAISLGVLALCLLALHFAYKSRIFSRIFLGK